MATVVIPSTAVIGQGTCTSNAPVQPVSASFRYGTYQWRYITLYPYVFTATPANGWAFDHFEITYFWVREDEDGRRSSGGTYAGITSNPFALRDFIDESSIDPRNWWTPEWVGEFWETNEGVEIMRKTCVSYTVTAVFVPDAHTHLLVNSATKESPAKLVYYPATNRLVADY